MPEQIAEKKSVQEEFATSAKYADLRKELADSIKSIELDENEKADRDMSPVFDYFEKEAMKNGLSEVQAERLFWQTVAEEVKETLFRDLYEMIRQYVEDKNYIEARNVVVDELDILIKQLSHTLYKNLSRKSVALTVLKEKFYKLFPEVEALIEETELERKSKVKIPTGQLGKDDYEIPPPSEGEFRERFRDLYLVEERNWEVPDHKELVRGLIVIFWSKDTKISQKMEFLEMPHLGEGGDFFVKVSWGGYADVIGLINLADFGLMAYAQTGLWNSRHIPQHWEIKKEKK